MNHRLLQGTISGCRHKETHLFDGLDFSMRKVHGLLFINPYKATHNQMSCVQS